MIQFTITEEIRHRVEKRMDLWKRTFSQSITKKKMDNTYLGFLGEEVALSVLGGTLLNHRLYDLEIDGVKYEVCSSRVKNVPPEMSEEFLVGERKAYQCPDYYLFIKIFTNQVAWICGRISRKDFLEKSISFSKDEYTFNGRSIFISQLEPMNTKKETVMTAENISSHNSNIIVEKKIDPLMSKSLIGILIPDLSITNSFPYYQIRRIKRYSCINILEEANELNLNVSVFLSYVNNIHDNLNFKFDEVTKKVSLDLKDVAKLLEVDKTTAELFLEKKSSNVTLDEFLRSVYVTPIRKKRINKVGLKYSKKTKVIEEMTQQLSQIAKTLEELKAEG